MFNNKQQNNDKNSDLNDLSSERSRLLWQNYRIEIRYLKNAEKFKRLFPEIIKSLEEDDLTVEQIAELVKPLLDYEAREKRNNTLYTKHDISIDSMKNEYSNNELFSDIVKRFDENLSIEEMIELVKPIVEYENKESKMKQIFEDFSREYNKIVEEKIEENYKIDKIENIPLCKIIGQTEYKELKKLYPKDIENLRDIYLPIYEKYEKEHKYVLHFDFADITYFKDFIDKIKYYDGSLASDKEFNMFDEYLRRYGHKDYYGPCTVSNPTKKDIRANPIKYSSKRTTIYYFEYETYLKLKDDMQKEIKIILNSRFEKRKEKAVKKIKEKYKDFFNTYEVISMSNYGHLR